MLNKDYTYAEYLINTFLFHVLLITVLLCMDQMENNAIEAIYLLLQESTAKTYVGNVTNIVI